MCPADLTGALELVITSADHADASVRCSVPKAVADLLGHEEFDVAPELEARAIAVLIGLCDDDEGEVRDLATFVIGAQLDRDTAEIRSALTKRLADADAAVRGEALLGLSRRHAPGLAGHVLSALADPGVAGWAIEAAEMARLPELVPALRALLHTGDDDALILDAIHRCDPAEQTADLRRFSTLLDMAGDLQPRLDVSLCSELLPVDDGGVQVVVDGGRRCSTYSWEPLLDRAGGNIRRMVELIDLDHPD